MKYVPYPVIDMKKTGENIQRIRVSRNLDIKDVQQFLGLPSTHIIYCWQNGITLPSVNHLCAISKLFNVSMDSLIILEDSHPPRLYAETTPEPLLPLFCNSIPVLQM